MHADHPAPEEQEQGEFDDDSDELGEDDALEDLSTRARRDRLPDSAVTLLLELCAREGV